VHLTTRWARRMRALIRTEPATDTQLSTLELFFAEIRWTEDVDPHGQRTLRRGVL
jgi:hypothetical protein